MSERDDKLREKFSILQNTYPATAGNMEFIGGGHFALVAANLDADGQRDGTVTKFFFRQDNAESEAETEQVLDNEVTVLRGLKGAPVGGVAVPELIGDPQKLDGDPNFSAAYKMTEVPGRAAGWNWQKPYKDDAPEEQREHFRQAGTLLAHFQRAAAALPADAPLRRREWGGHVEQVPGLDAETNRALAEADRYLQAHKIPGVVHGDYHGGNVNADSHGNITGLIDFGETSFSDNIATDFVNIPASVFDQFKEGYERESGEKIDPLMMTVTAISGTAGYLNDVWNDPEKREKAIRDLNWQLTEAQAITGFSPPAPP